MNTEQGLPIGPVPTSTAVGHADTPDGKRVILQCITPTGLACYFLSVEHVDSLVSQLQEARQQAATGLVVVPSLDAL